MAKTKISEFSPTPGNNTDIDNINLAEGCAPSGINDAIRELMAQLKDFQAGTAGDSFNGPIGSTTAVTGAFTNITASGTLGVTGVATLGNGAVLGTPTSVTLTNATGLPIATGVSGLGTGVATALAVNVGSAGAPVLFNGALGTPASGTVTNLTGTASININGTVGATTANTGAFTTLAASSTVTLSGGTANGVAYLNASKELTTGSALTFDGTNFGVGGSGDPFGRFYGRSVGLSSASSAFLELNAATGSTSGIDFGVNATRTAGITSNTTETNFTTLGATPLLFGIGGSEQMRLTSTGLGIGTSSPGVKLDVQGSVPFARVKDNSTGYLGFRAENNSGNFYFGIDSSAGAFYGSAYARVLYSDGAYPMVFYTNAAERMRLDSSGNLGLGVTPSAWQSIYRAAQFPAGVSVVGRNDGGIEGIFATNAFRNSAGTWTYVNNGVARRYVQEADGHLWLTAPSGTAGDAISFTQAMTLTAGGVQLLGTTSTPSGGTVASVLARASTTNLQVHSTDGGGAMYGGLSGGGAIFYTYTGAVGSETYSERARIDSSGNLLVGRSDSTGDRISAYNGTSADFLLLLRSDLGTQNFARFQYAGTTIGSITGNATNTAYNTSSDYRLKNITGPITTSGAYIDSLNPVEGTWKADGSTFVGLIAHEVQEASRTNVATGVKDGEEMQAMDYSSAELIANMLAELKSLRARVAALESI